MASNQSVQGVVLLFLRKRDFGFASPYSTKVNPILISVIVVIRDGGDYGFVFIPTFLACMV